MYRSFIMVALLTLIISNVRLSEVRRLKTVFRASSLFGPKKIKSIHVCLFELWFLLYCLHYRSARIIWLTPSKGFTNFTFLTRQKSDRKTDIQTNQQTD